MVAGRGKQLVEEFPVFPAQRPAEQFPGFLFAVQLLGEGKHGAAHFSVPPSPKIPAIFPGGGERQMEEARSMSTGDMTAAPKFFGRCR